MKKIDKKLSKIKLMILDFDGTLTDNKVYVSEEGKEFVRCDRGDGLGIELLKKLTNIEIIILSKEKNKVVNARAKKLGIECIQGKDSKIIEYQKIIKNRKLKNSEVCFIGNDINDLECIKISGTGIAVRDAYPILKKNADFVTLKNGGKGAVREIADRIIKLNKRNISWKG
jgi:YrbI family 3-deoxy-D-manno-octulosonate 8-phosphate phosphatase